MLPSPSSSWRLPVMNVVSAAKILELPDMTVADVVGRLPGVALIRVGGEGSQVIIRGMAPQYNQVTIEGVELPSDIPSSNNITSVDAASGTLARLGDRAEDLSMISSTMIGGIEVVKAITPDMDAALIGGTINFTLRRAARSTAMTPRNTSWIPSLELRTEGGYNGLKNTRNDYRVVSVAREQVPGRIARHLSAGLDRAAQPERQYHDRHRLRCTTRRRTTAASRW